MAEKDNIPKHWQLKKLGDVCKLKNGYAFKSDKYENIGVPVIRISDINGGTVSSQKAVRVKKNAKYDNYLVKYNDILVAMSGATTGKFGVYRSIEKAYQNQRVGKFKILNENILNNNFLFHQINSLKRQIEKDAYGGAQPNISSTKIEQMQIAVPPLPEQQAIVAKIEELLSELENGKQQLQVAQQQLKVYRQSLLKWAFEGKEQTIVGELFDFVGGGTPSKKIPEYWQGDIPWASVKDIKGDYLKHTQDRISASGLKDSASNLAKPKDVILITRISPGKTIISNIETAINQDLKIVKPKFETTPKFIFYVLKSIEWECVKKSSGTTVLGINLTSLKEISVPKLNLKEQQIIVDELESKLTVCDKIDETISQSLQQAETLRQSILKKAFEGKLV